MSSAETFIRDRLNERRAAGNFRELKPNANLVDLCSNDYLGFARSAVLKDMIGAELSANQHALNGSTGSRLLTGNTDYVTLLELGIARIHGFEAGLLFNSGYDANLGLLSSVPQRGDTIITDELIHASIIDGARLSHANRYTFIHNDLNSLEAKLKNAKGNCYVVVESVYSMDGDMAPIAEIVTLADQYGAHLIVDEAHAIGVFGYGIIDQLKLQQNVFATVVTFGKAMGCHGAIVLGSAPLKQYLVNFARSFIYTTAAPFHQLAAIKMAYQLLQTPDTAQALLQQNIDYFNELMTAEYGNLRQSNSAIHCILTGSNQSAKGLAALIQQNGLDVRPILSPTVALGTERVRICLHAFNSKPEIDLLAQIINKFKE